MTFKKSFPSAKTKERNFTKTLRDLSLKLHKFHDLIYIRTGSLFRQVLTLLGSLRAWVSPAFLAGKKFLMELSFDFRYDHPYNMGFKLARYRSSHQRSIVKFLIGFT
jgi:hypothetical protein